MISSARTVRLMFAGGGTGGHLFPAIAIADRVRELLRGKREVEILFVGTKRGLEYRIRESLGYPLLLINVRGLARSFSLKNLLVPFLLMGALIKANSLINHFKPDIAVGTGGYVSLPVLKIASAKKIPTVIQEQNSFPGISTRKLATDAKRVYLGFAEAGRHIQSCGQIITTGNPVRRAVLGGDRSEALKAFELDPERKTILVLGGSQGARSVNNAVLKSLESSGSPGSGSPECGLPGNYQLMWQTGKRDYKDVIAKAGDKVSPHALFPFEDRMHLVYAAADLVIARAGALTLAELQACNIPSVLIPYPFAAGDHQQKNALQFVDAGFARVIDPAELDGVDLLKTAVDLIDSGKVDDMRRALKKTTSGQKPAVDIIAEDIISLLDEQGTQEETIGA